MISLKQVLVRKALRKDPSVRPVKRPSSLKKTMHVRELLPLIPLQARYSSHASSALKVSECQMISLSHSLVLVCPAHNIYIFVALFFLRQLSSADRLVGLE